MNADLNWTTQLGQAVYSQQKEVMQSIQRLRSQAKAAGSLKSNSQQTVVVENNVIKIVPAQPNVIYVPAYDPQVVYVQQDTSGAAAAALISFGVGVAMGAWMSSSCDWYHYGVVNRGRPVHYNTAVMNRTVVRSVSYPTWTGARVTAGTAHNTATGWTTRAATSYNPYTGRSSAASAHYNPYTGNVSSTAATRNPHTGNVTVRHRR
jgi:uncharacterized protein DUF3300